MAHEDFCQDCPVRDCRILEFHQGGVIDGYDVATHCAEAKVEAVSEDDDEQQQQS